MIRFFVRHPTAANLLMLVLLVMGLLSVRKLQRETFPDFRKSEVEIAVPYPGATAVDVEETICRRVEDAIDGVRYVHEVRAEAREGIGIVTVEMEEGADFITFKDEIDTQVRAIDDFPDDVEEPVIRQLHTTDPVLSLIVSGPMSARDLKFYCESLKDRLQTLPDVSLVRIMGFSDHQFRIELSAEALMRHDISAADVASRIAAQSVDLPAGVLETRERDILVRFVDQRSSVDELGDLVIVAAAGGGELRVRDLGRVIDLFESAEDRIEIEGRRAALLAIEKTRNQDTLRVAATIKSFLEEERARQPQVSLQVTQDFSTLVNDRLQMLLNNGWQGAILVFLTLWLFFNARLSFWVVMSLPVSFLGACYFLPLFGLTINMLTMVGLLLALGLLMDDGIVIAENIATHRAAGKSALNAAIDGVTEVAGGVFSSFITTVAVLGSLSFLDGDIGKVLKVVPMVLILVLMVSLIEAFFILPAHLAHSTRAPSARINGFRRFFNNAIEYTRENIFGRAIDTALRHRYLWLGIVGMAFFGGLSLVASGLVRFQAFPDLDGDIVVARVLMPPGTPLQRTQSVVDDIVGALKKVDAELTPLQPGKQPLVRNAYVQFNLNADAFEVGPHVATVTVDLLRADARKGRIDDIVNVWRKHVGNVPDALSLVFTEPALGPAGRNLEIRLAGESLDNLRQAALETKLWLNDFHGVYNLTEDLRRGKPEVRIRMREGAMGLGLTAANLARQLRTAFQGAKADEIQVGPESYEIDVQLAADDQNSVADLDYFHCTLPGGRQVPLSAVAYISQDRGWSRITRVNGRRTVTLRGDIDPRQSNTIQLINALKSEYLPLLHERRAGVSVDFEGEIRESATVQGSMRRAMLIGLIGVFVLLSYQFRSYVEPLIVMTAIPLALIGVLAGHFIMRLDLSMPSALGFISLAGVVVNDSILLVLFLKQHRAAGVPVLEAARRAGRERFRAIMLTSLTTMAGLIPLLFERSIQAQILIPLVVSIVFGLLASTVLVLLVVPSLYTIMSDFGWTAKIDSDDEA